MGHGHTPSPQGLQRSRDPARSIAIHHDPNTTADVPPSINFNKIQLHSKCHSDGGESAPPHNSSTALCTKILDNGSMCTGLSVLG